MKTEIEFKSYKTSENFQVLNITADVKKFVEKHQISKGYATITTQHTTTAIVLNEDEKFLISDIQNHLMELTPREKGYAHDNIKMRDNCPPDEPTNAHSHIKAILLGASENIPVFEGKLVLGRWQNIMLIELDGPRERKVSFALVGE